MRKLNKNEMKNINGVAGISASAIGIGIGISIIISFFVGVVSGIVNPEPCGGEE